MQFDVFLASHAGQFGMHRKLADGIGYRADRFVDYEGFRAAVSRLEEAYRRQLAREAR